MRTPDSAGRGSRRLGGPRTTMVRTCVQLLAVFFIAGDTVEAQQGERRGFIGLGIGPSMPLGSFADETQVHLAGRGAATGYTSTLVNLGYRFRDRLGFSAALAYSEYPIHDVGDDDWWQVASVFGGPMYSVRLNTRAAMDFKAMLGLVVLTPVEDGFSTSGRVGSGLGVDVRAAIRYDVFRRWAVFAESGVQSSGASFGLNEYQGYRALISGFGAAFRPEW